MKTQANSNYENQVIDRFWSDFKQQSRSIMESEPVLADLFNKLVFTCSNFDQCLARIISSKLATREVDKQQLFQVCMQAYAENRCLLENAIADVYAVLTRDPASSSIVRILMFLKGPHVIESWRISHWLWEQDRKDLACYIQSRISDVFSVDIHPAARIGKGLMLDHATNIVIGETAVIEDTVSLLHDVTLGGTGKECGDRHPKVCKGVMIGAGAKILAEAEAKASQTRIDGEDAILRWKCLLWIWIRHSRGVNLKAPNLYVRESMLNRFKNTVIIT